MIKQEDRKILTKKDIFSYYTLTVFLSIFIIMIFYEKMINYYVLIISIITALVLLKGFILIHKMPVHHRYGLLEHYNVIIACVIGAISTYFLSFNLNLGPVLGASIVGLTAYYACHYSKTTADLPPPVYSGAFVGMVSPLILSNIFFVGIAGFIAGILFYLSHDIYTGLGGKLGTIAFSGVVITVIIVKLIGVI